jgi:hypothetical protein
MTIFDNDGVSRAPEGSTDTHAVIESPSGIFWRVCRKTGEGVRITPLPVRPGLRSPSAITRQFPLPDPCPKMLDKAALLSLVSADGSRSRALTMMLAIAPDTAPTDADAALNWLAHSEFRGLGQFSHECVAYAYLALRPAP